MSNKSLFNATSAVFLSLLTLIGCRRTERSTGLQIEQLPSATSSLKEYSYSRNTTAPATPRIGNPTGMVGIPLLSDDELLKIIRLEQSQQILQKYIESPKTTKSEVEACIKKVTKFAKDYSKDPNIYPEASLASLSLYKVWINRFNPKALYKSKDDKDYYVIIRDAELLELAKDKPRASVLAKSININKLEAYMNRVKEFMMAFRAENYTEMYELNQTFINAWVERYNELDQKTKTEKVHIPKAKQVLRATPVDENDPELRSGYGRGRW